MAQDEAEARAREAEASLERLQAENEQVHEQLAFREEEVEEMRLELEVEKERHSVEMEEMAGQLAEASKKAGSGGASGEKSTINGVKSSDEKKSVNMNGNGMPHKDDISVMTEDEDFVTMAVGSQDPDGDDQEDYIKRLEDELEDVTEQLIEAETNISNFEGKLGAAEKKKVELEEKVKTMEAEMEKLQSKATEEAATTVPREEFEEMKAHKESAKEELALIGEELKLTQEELKAAEEDAKVAAANLEKAQGDHKKELDALKKTIEATKGDAKNVDKEVDDLQQALAQANAESNALREEVQNLTEALDHARQDNERAMEEMQDLRNAFDEAEENVRQTAAERLEDLTKEHNREIQDLQAELLSLQEANKAITAAAEKASGPSAAEIDLQTKLEQKQKELDRIKNDLSEERKENIKSKRKIEELSAGNRALVAGALDFQKKKHDSMSAPIKPLKSIDMDEEEEDDEDAEASAFYRSHARSRRRQPHEPSKRARSSSPTTVVRLEREIVNQSKKINTLTSESESLKSQKRMSDVRVKHLEKDVAKLHDELEKAEEKSDNLVMKVVESGLQNPEARDDKDILDSDMERILSSGSKDDITNEFRALARRSTLQKEHNAQLLVKILKLQGNIQVCCRIRPLTNGEIKKGIKRVVEPLSESEVGVFNSRTNNWKSFAFDKVWGPDSHQLGIFQDVEPLALSVVDGYNACIFAYGQT